MTEIIGFLIYIVVAVTILIIGSWNADLDRQGDSDGPLGIAMAAVCWPFILGLLALLSPIWIPALIAIGINRWSKKLHVKRQAK